MRDHRRSSVLHVLWTAVLTASVLLAGVFAGRAYTYCRMMGQFMAPGCGCDPIPVVATIDPTGERRTALQQAGGPSCFELRAFDGLVSDRTPSVANVAPLTTVATLAPVVRPEVASTPKAVETE